MEHGALASPDVARTPDGVADLQHVLQEHRRWLESDRRDGSRADLSLLDLRGRSLAGANLRAALLRDTRLQDAELEGADLRDAEGLLPDQLAGSNLKAARLPESLSYTDALANIAHMSHIASVLFVILLLGCAYVGLTTAATTDVELITNSATSELPIIQTRIRIVSFYWTAPLVLLGFYTYFHVFAQRLWEELADLPALFPDGRPLDKKAYPWFLNDLVRAHFLHLRRHTPGLFLLQRAVAGLLAWWLVPLTILAIWLRYLPRHDWGGTSFHVLALGLSILTAYVFHRLAVSTLRREPRPAFTWRRVFRTGRSIRTFSTLILVLIGGSLLSLGAINGSHAPLSWNAPGTWVPHLLRCIGYSPHADFEGADVSTPPASVPQTLADRLALTRGASLAGRDLRYMSARAAFLAKADLRRADLRGAVLEEAVLQEANLELVRLTGANLEDAELQGATLYGADLVSIGLNRADLRHANLAYANLQDASLFEADLSGADLTAANLQGASLEGADLRAANLGLPVGLTQAQIDSACTDSRTRLPEGFRRSQRECTRTEDSPR
ncbi:MAG: pentapeptide repeat-containing protein [Gammaproteobacteria bacterium]